MRNAAQVTLLPALGLGACGSETAGKKPGAGVGSRSGRMAHIRALAYPAVAVAALAGVVACSSSDPGRKDTSSSSGGSSSASSSRPEGGSSGKSVSGSGGDRSSKSSSAPGGGSPSKSSSSSGGSASSGRASSASAGGDKSSGGLDGSGGSSGGSSGSLGGSGSSSRDLSTNGSGGSLGGSGSSSRDSSTNGSGGSSSSRDSSTNSSGGSSSEVNSPGCGTTVTRPSSNVQQTITVGGKTRYYLLDVPADADNTKPLMLIFALHGYNMNNVSIVGLFNFTSRSNGTAITVYPQGEGDPPGNVSHWGSGINSTFEPNEANYTFIHDLMMDLESRYCIDTRRVFLAGFSMGGLFTNFTACNHAEWFRAYAPVEGMGPGGSQDGATPLSCANVNAKPAIMIHQGAADTSVPPAQGEKTRDFWATRNGCSNTTTSSFTGCKSYSGCAQPVVYCPGSWSHTIDPQAAGNIWSFFSGI